jgi:hypothetical protein
MADEQVTFGREYEDEARKNLQNLGISIDLTKAKLSDMNNFLDGLVSTFANPKLNERQQRSNIKAIAKKFSVELIHKNADRNRSDEKISKSISGLSKTLDTLNGLPTQIKSAVSSAVKPLKVGLGINDVHNRKYTYEYVTKQDLNKTKMIEMFLPSVASNALNLSKAGDSLREYYKLNKNTVLGRVAKSIYPKLGGLGTFAASGLGPALGIAAALKAIQFIDRQRKTYVSSREMEQRTGVEFSMKRQMNFMSRAGLMGVSQEQASEMQKNYAKFGLFNPESVLSGIASEKLYGAENVPAYFQMLTRRFSDVSKSGFNLENTFKSLQAIAARTKMGIPELQQSVSGFVSSFKGEGFRDSQVQALMYNFKDFLKNKELSATDIAGIYNRTQTAGANQLLTMVAMAERGGYRFKSQGNLLDKAYELRRLQGGDLDSKFNLARAELKGVYSMFGVSSFKQLSGSQKFSVSEDIFKKLLGLDLSKLPSLEKIIELIESGRSASKMPDDIAQEIRNAQGTDTEDILRHLNLISDPVGHIKGLLFSLVEGRGKWDSNAVQNYINSINNKDENDKNKKSEKDEQPMVITLLNATQHALDILPPNIPGKNVVLKK